MRSWKRAAYGAGIIGAAVTAMAASLAPASAAPAWYTTYVSPHASAHHSGKSCATARFRSVQAAVNATAVGGTVIVCRGVYRESVTITKPLVVRGKRGAVIACSCGRD